MPQNPPFCCTTHLLPTSATNSYLKLLPLNLIPTSSHHHPSPSSISSTSYTSILQLFFFNILHRALPAPHILPPTLSRPSITLFPQNPPEAKLPLKIIELETIQSTTHHTRHFSHRYFVELDGSWHEKQMFPEESFAEVEWARVEERWRRGQGYKEGRDEERRKWIGGRVGEWVFRDDAGELGRRRVVGWECKNHEWAYWVREIRWADDGETT